MNINALTFPYDVFERHKFIASRLKNNQTVLDVGGELKNLSFFSKSRIKEANLTSGDIIYGGQKLPVADNSFNAVTSIDVLEHIPPKERSEFIADLVRVATDLVIVSAPFGSKSHLKLEKKLLISMEKKGKIDLYLKEHVENGIPELAEVKKLATSQEKFGKINFYYSGNIYLSAWLFKIHSSQILLPIFGRVYYYFKLIFNTLVNMVYYHLAIGSKPKETTNRFYLILSK